MHLHPIALLAGFGLISSLGCALLDSSGSISESVSSPFESSSASSDGEDGASSHTPEHPAARMAYANDVQRLATTYAEAPGEIDALRSQVSKLASARGITDWEADELTCTSLVDGTRAGRMSPAQQAAFSNEICPPR